MPEWTIERVLWFWLVPEIAFLLVLLYLLAASLLGQANAASAYPRQLRLAALAFVAVELLIPAWIYYDVRRRPEATSTIWVHAAAMPLVNLLGLFGYLEARRREAGRAELNE